MPKRKHSNANFIGQTRSYIESLALLRPDAPVVVALSGGADSVALLAALTELGYRCVAAHCNFHLRGEESRRDMLHAVGVARSMDVDFSVRDFDVQAQMASSGESVEMACRTLRYGWFADLADSIGAQAIAVGHHREDRAETFFLNLMRGSGIAGLTSMNPRSGDVVRPLLWASRMQIEHYLDGRGLTYIVDSSNASDAHRRNRIRNRLMPLMEELFPGAGEAILRTVTNLEATRNIYNEAIRAKTEAHTLPDGSIDVRALRGEPHGASILFEMIRHSGFTPTQASDIVDSSTLSGAVFRSPAGAEARLERGRLVIGQSTGGGDPHSWSVELRRDIVTPVRIDVCRRPVDCFRDEVRDSRTIFLDADYALDPSAKWRLRHWRRGDRMIPFGSCSPKLVSDIFANAKADSETKASTWLLTRDDDIVWVAGIRASALGTLTPESRAYVRLRLGTAPPCGDVHTGTAITEDNIIQNITKRTT